MGNVIEVDQESRCVEHSRELRLREAKKPSTFSMPPALMYSEVDLRSELMSNLFSFWWEEEECARTNYPLLRLPLVTDLKLNCALTPPISGFLILNSEGRSLHMVGI